MANNKGMSVRVQKGVNRACLACTGLEIARQIFGECSRRNFAVADFEASVELAKKAQGSSPYEPQSDVAVELQQLVEEKMNLNPRSVAVCTAIGSRLGFEYGISAFVEFDDCRVFFTDNRSGL